MSIQICLIHGKELLLKIIECQYFFILFMLIDIHACPDLMFCVERQKKSPHLSAGIFFVRRSSRKALPLRKTLDGSSVGPDHRGVLEIDFFHIIQHPGIIFKTAGEILKDFRPLLFGQTVELRDR